MRCTVVVMAKAPVAGAAKTRLIPALGADGAARVAAAGLDATWRAAHAAATGPVALAAAPQARHPALARWAEGADAIDQPDADLGARMAAAMVHGWRHAPAALVIGTDAPGLDAAVLRRAAAALDDSPAVLVPAVDGGYVAVGLRADAARLLPALFDPLPWSTPAVLARTRERLAAAGATAAELAPLHDVDTEDDLPWLPDAWRSWRGDAPPEGA